MYSDRRGKDAGYEIRGSGKRTEPSQGEGRTPTDTQGGRRKVGFQIPICIYKYLSVSDRTDMSVSGV